MNFLPHLKNVEGGKEHLRVDVEPLEILLKGGLSLTELKPTVDVRWRWAFVDVLREMLRNYNLHSNLS